jgi:hypothetical protein
MSWVKRRFSPWVLASSSSSPGLEERRLGSTQSVDLASVDVVADDAVAQCGHTGGVHGADVAEPDDADCQLLAGGDGLEGRGGGVHRFPPEGVDGVEWWTPAITRKWCSSGPRRRRRRCWYR